MINIEKPYKYIFTVSGWKIFGPDLKVYINQIQPRYVDDITDRLNEQHAEIERLREIVACQQHLLQCHRLGTRPDASVLIRIDHLQKEASAQ